MRPRSGSRSTTSWASINASTSVETVALVRPVSAASCARDSLREAAICRSTRERLCRFSSCCRAGTLGSGLPVCFGIRAKSRLPLAMASSYRSSMRAREMCPSRTSAYRARIAGSGSASNRNDPLSGHGWGLWSGTSTHFAWNAAPSATYSPGGGTRTGRPKIAGAIRRRASDRLPPPIRRTRSISTPCDSTASSASARPHNRPSTAARARWAGVDVLRLRP